MGNDTITKTLLVAGLLSIICSVIVSSAAVFLKSNQVKMAVQSFSDFERRFRNVPYCGHQDSICGWQYVTEW